MPLCCVTDSIDRLKGCWGNIWACDYDYYNDYYYFFCYLYVWRI